MISVATLRGGVLSPALQYLEQGAVDKAFKSYRVLVKQQPLNAGLKFNFGNALYGRGLAAEAEAEYRAALELDKTAPDIINNLAAAIAEQGRVEEALDLCDRGLAITPGNAALLRTRATQRSSVGKFDEALQDADELLRIAPGMADAYNTRGDILAKMHRFDEAIEAFRKAIEMDSRSTLFRTNLGNVYAAKGALPEAAATFTGILKENRRDVKTMNQLAAVLQRMNKHEDAIRACELALSVQPDYADAHNRMAQSYLSLEKWQKAIDIANDVIALHPGHQEALFNLGMALIGARRYAEAIDCFDQILAAGPKDDMALLNLGNALNGAGRSRDAVDAYTRMIAQQPQWAGGYMNRGHAFGRLREWDSALADYNKAAELEPQKKDHLYNIGNVYLHQGDFERGWKGYEHRNNSSEGVQRRHPDIPVWTGEDLSGKRLLVFGEQGLGDNIQMARYLPLLQKKAATVSFHGYPMLRALFQTSAPGLTYVDTIEPKDFDFQIASMSLPKTFGTRVDTVPQNIPYFVAEPERIAKWAERIGSEGFRIGINWQGNPSGKIDEGRSAPLKQFLRFADVPGVRIISMQKNHGLDQLKDVPDHIKVQLLGDDFDSGKDAFLDTLAVLSNLDLVVTTDTSLVHVAGGFGARTFVGLKDSPDWRWMYDRSDSPWYPTARLFRQTEFGNWDHPFIAMTEAIHELVSAKG